MKVFQKVRTIKSVWSSSISLFIAFWKKSENRCQKGYQKSRFWVQKLAFNAQWSIDSPIFVDFWGSKKSLIFSCVSCGPKKRKNWPSASQRPIGNDIVTPGCPVFGNQGPREPPFSRRAKAKKQGTKYKEQGTGNRSEEGSNTSVARGLANLKTSARTWVSRRTWGPSPS